MRIPNATYRLQFNASFTFHDAVDILEYIHTLGISDVYAAPILQSKKDSVHGYDVTDPALINVDLGGRDAFMRLAARAREQGLGWIQDIVPNHMAFDSANHLLMDVLEKGPLSKYYTMFDIQWEHPYDHLRHKLLAPFLGDLYGACLDRKEISIEYGEKGFQVRFYEWSFPLRIDCYPKILGSNLMALESRVHADHEDYLQFLEIIHGLKNLSNITDLSDCSHLIALLKARLWKLYTTSAAFKEYINGILRSINGAAGDPRSFDRLDEALSAQYYRLAYWKVGNEEINYRRFFTINGLISLNMDHPEAFEVTHRLILNLVHSGKISGLRIDHIDGLYNPLEYLERLRMAAKDVYVAVEKILDAEESLPRNMPVQGTTGYDFLNVVNGLFINRFNEQIIDKFYVSFTGIEESYREMVCIKKKFFMGRFMAGDIDNLALLLKKILNHNRYGKDMTMYALRRAIVEIMAYFPVYRSYRGEQNTRADQAHIKEAIVSAQNANPSLIHEIKMIGEILLAGVEGKIHGGDPEDYRHFAKRFQQFSGPLMAKGAEDTTFYIYNRFISLNEVGSDPSVFGLSVNSFHDLMVKRLAQWPHTMNATSTHDTKRGEDVRARLNVLSQIPHEWAAMVRTWARINKPKKTHISTIETVAPNRNDEYFIYQTLVGTYPWSDADAGPYLERMKDYIIKAVRESQVNTAWINPNAEYENACLQFLERLIDPGEGKDFLESFLPFQRTIARRGIWNALAQVAVKMTAPGVPDFYQGSELWDLSLVDPDNRRPVDYAVRKTMLADIRACEDQRKYLSDLVAHKEDGQIKMYFIYRGLALRRLHPEVFSQGEYVPVRVEGRHADDVIAFARRAGAAWVLTVVSRCPLDPDPADDWSDTFIHIPDGAPAQWRHIFNGDVLSPTDVLPLNLLFGQVPAAILISF